MTVAALRRLRVHIAALCVRLHQRLVPLRALGWLPLVELEPSAAAYRWRPEWRAVGDEHSAFRALLVLVEQHRLRHPMKCKLSRKVMSVGHLPSMEGREQRRNTIWIWFPKKLLL